MLNPNHSIVKFLHACDPPLSILDLAAVLGVSHITVYRWIDGSRRPSLERIYKLNRMSGGQVNFVDFVRTA